MTSVKTSGWVEFRFYRPDVREVWAVGDFSGWWGCMGRNGPATYLDKIQLKPLGDGWWMASARLEPGEYRFRYLAGGQWFTDFAANGIEKIERGKPGWNSILNIPEEVDVEERSLVKKVA